MQAPPATILDFKLYSKNTLRGFFDLRLASGMILRGCMLHSKGDRFWIALPAKSYTNEAGEQAWCRIIDFSNKETRDRFQQTITPLAVEALEQAKVRGAA
jgi:hypothetical protein